MIKTTKQVMNANYIKSITSTKNIDVSINEALRFHGFQFWELCLNGHVSFISSDELHDRKDELLNIIH